MQEETSVLRTGAVSGMDATRVTSASPTYESALSTEKCPSPTRSECGVRAGASQATMSILLPTASHVHSVARRDASGRPVTLIHSRDLRIRLSCSQMAATASAASLKKTSVSTSGPSGSRSATVTTRAWNTVDSTAKAVRAMRGRGHQGSDNATPHAV